MSFQICTNIRPHICQCNIAVKPVPECGQFYSNMDTIVAYYASWKAISPSKLVSNGYISNHNKKVTPTPKSQSMQFFIDIVELFLYTFYSNLNIENFQKSMQSITSDSCFI